MTPKQIALKCAEICEIEANHYGVSAASGAYYDAATRIRAYADTLPSERPAIPEGMVLLPRRLSKPLLEAMGAMDGYEPREKEVFPYQRYQDYFDALCDAAAPLQPKEKPVTGRYTIL